MTISYEVTLDQKEKCIASTQDGACIVFSCVWGSGKLGYGLSGYKKESASTSLDIEWMSGELDRNDVLVIKIGDQNSSSTPLNIEKYDHKQLLSEIDGLADKGSVGDKPNKKMNIIKRLQHLLLKKPNSNEHVVNTEPAHIILLINGIEVYKSMHSAEDYFQLSIRSSSNNEVLSEWTNCELPTYRDVSNKILSVGDEIRVKLDRVCRV